MGKDHLILLRLAKTKVTENSFRTASLSRFRSFSQTILPLNPADPKEMWARLRRAVRSGEYRGKIKPNHGTSDAPLFWEPLFVPGSGNEAIEEYRLPSSSADPETTHHSGPGPPRRRHTLSGANQEWDDFEVGVH